ncbi:hypothetical protein GJ496_006811, partial [Pomphorhynchus laevis]
EAKNNYRCLYPPINEICSTDLVGLRATNLKCYIATVMLDNSSSSWFDFRGIRNLNLD